MTFDRTIGQLSGTPTQSGVYTFKVRVSGTNQPTLEHAYTFAITTTNQVLPPHSTVDTVSYPLDTGDITGLGMYTNGDSCTVTATARPGYRFVRWTDNDSPVSTTATYQFPVTLNRSLVANFVAAPEIRMMLLPANSCALEWPSNAAPCVLEESSDLVSTNWSVINAPVSAVGTNSHVELPLQPGARFYRLRLQ
jgi:hypothetical protein